MSIGQITTANTFGQLITAVAAMIAVANNLTDGPQVSSNAAWTFTNPGVGVNVGNTALIKTANIQFINSGFANIVSGNIASINTSSANITTANVVGATITNIISTDHLSANANISGLLQVSDRMNVYSANIQSANIGSLALTTLSVSELTVPVLNASFANVTTLSVTGTSQHLAVIATLVTTDNCNVIRLNATTANITDMTFGTMNTGFSNTTSANIVSMNVGFANIVSANIMSANIGFMNVTTATFTTVIVSSANIVSMNVGFANIVSANIISINSSSVNITSGSITVSANPTTNLAVATKNYADTGAGGNLVSKLSFNVKGDLPVGNAAQNFAILPSGSNGQYLVVDTQTATGLRWGGRAANTFRGLIMATSIADNTANQKQLTVYKLDEVVMDDGEVVTGWNTPATIDISASGINGLDGGTANANTWYEVYAVRKRVDGTKNFIIHRAPTRLPEQNTFSSFYPYTAANPAGFTLMGSGNTTNYTRLAQSFTPNVAGTLTSIEVRAFRTLTPTGNLWLTVEGNTAGIPNSTILATSRKLDVSRLLLTPMQNVKFVFDTTATLAAGTSYYWTINMDNTASSIHYVNVAFSVANTEIGANGVNRGVPYGFSGSWLRVLESATGPGTFIYKAFIESNNTPVTLPAGYDQKTLISYVATDVNNKIKEFYQKDRMLITQPTSQWAALTISPIAQTEIVDLTLVVPPVTCFTQFWALGTSLNVYAYGRFHALDMSASMLESFQGTSGWGQIAFNGSTTASPSAPILIEHQALLIKSGLLNMKLYPATITF